VKVVYVAPYYSEALAAHRSNSTYRSPAGIAKMEGVVSAMESAGCAVTVVSPVLFGQRSGRFYGAHCETLGQSEVLYPSVVDIPVLGILWSIVATLLALSTLRRNGRAERLVFYNFAMPTALPAFMARLFFGIPLVVEYEDGLFADPDIPRTKRFISLALERLGKPLVTGGILVSSLLAARLGTANTCLCRGFFRPLAEDSPAPPSEGQTILYAGRFDRSRGVDIFLEAVSLLSEPATVVITGYGPLDAWVNERIRAITGIKVVKHPFLSPAEYRQLLAGVDVVVNPQRCSVAFGQASFPSKVYEYLSAGRLVVSSRVSDIESFAEGKMLLYDNDSPADLASVLDEVLAHPEKYREYGIRGRKWVAENCSYGMVGKNIRHVLERA